MKETILSIQSLRKNFGSIKAVDALSLEIEKGSVYGILGPNGSGKTTTLGILLGVIIPTSGTFQWFGHAPRKEDRRRIGAILEVPTFYPYLSGLRNLRLVADIKRKSYDDLEDLLKMVNLWDRRHSPFRTYSLGMKQRLAIAATLVGKPEVMILDEPTNGLDPLGIAEIRGIIRQVAASGTTIILASHILDEVQKTCTHVVVLEKGKSLFAGRVDEVLNDSSWVELNAPEMARLYEIIKEAPFISEFREENDMIVVRLKEAEDLAFINRYMAENGIYLSHLASRKRTLENYFLELMTPS